MDKTDKYLLGGCLVLSGIALAIIIAIIIPFIILLWDGAINTHELIQSMPK